MYVFCNFGWICQLEEAVQKMLLTSILIQELQRQRAACEPALQYNRVCVGLQTDYRQLMKMLRFFTFLCSRTLHSWKHPANYISAAAGFTETTLMPVLLKLWVITILNLWRQHIMVYVSEKRVLLFHFLQRKNESAFQCKLPSMSSSFSFDSSFLISSRMS